MKQRMKVTKEFSVNNYFLSFNLIDSVTVLVHAELKKCLVGSRMRPFNFSQQHPEQKIPNNKNQTSNK